MHQLILPLEPVAASRARVPRYGKPYYAGPYKRYREDVQLLIPAALEEAGISSPLEGLLEVSAFFLRPQPLTTKNLVPHQDTDNFLKAVLDVLNGRAWVDDKQIVRLTGEKLWSPLKRPMTVLRIQMWSPDESHARIAALKIT